MQSVFVLDKNRDPLVPCHPARARKLLRKGRAAVFSRYPFTIILLDREGGETQDIQIKFDPDHQPLIVTAKGRQSRLMCRPDKYGFPRTKAKQGQVQFGFQTGDMVRANDHHTFIILLRESRVASH